MKYAEIHIEKKPLTRTSTTLPNIIAFTIIHPIDGVPVWFMSVCVVCARSVMSALTIFIIGWNRLFHLLGDFSTFSRSIFYTQLVGLTAYVFAYKYVHIHHAFCLYIFVWRRFGSQM